MSSFLESPWFYSSKIYNLVEGNRERARANNYAPDFIVALLLLPCLRTITIANDYYDNQQLINQEIMPCRDETLTWIENMISNVSRHRNGWCCIVYV